MTSYFLKVLKSYWMERKWNYFKDVFIHLKGKVTGGERESGRRSDKEERDPSLTVSLPSGHDDGAVSGGGQEFRASSFSPCGWQGLRNLAHSLLSFQAHWLEAVWEVKKLHLRHIWDSNVRWWLYLLHHTADCRTKVYRAGSTLSCRILKETLT